MVLQLKQLVIGVFLALALSLCEAKNATVKVVGLIHCTDCIKNQPSSGNASSSGLDVFIICKATKSEAKTEGNGAINKEGKFSVTLSAMTEDPSSIDGCYAKLQGKSGAPCPIQSNQTASVKIVSNFAPKRVMNRPTVIKFSPITCQSAIFWHFPNLTFFSSPPPPPDYTPPPPEDLDFPPLASPVQPPLPPPENSTPPLPSPSYDPPAPEFGAPSPPPELSSGSPPPAPEFEAPSPQPELSFGSPPPAPPPTYQSPPSPTIQSPSPPPQAPPSRPQAPPVIDPIRAPTRPNPAKQSPPPTPALSGPPPQEKAIQPPPSAAISRPPSRRKPSPIPRAPPIPRLPLTPGAPRQYFNAPKSKSKPPRFT